MKAKELKIGGWVEYNKRPVEVVDIDESNEQAIVKFCGSGSYSTINTEQLIDNPQCHCDSHSYY